MARTPQSVTTFAILLMQTDLRKRRHPFPTDGSMKTRLDNLIGPTPGQHTFTSFEHATSSACFLRGMENTASARFRIWQRSLMWKGVHESSLRQRDGDTPAS